MLQLLVEEVTGVPFAAYMREAVLQPLGMTGSTFDLDEIAATSGSVPAWGAMLRVDPTTGNGMVLLLSGGGGAVNRLGHDWVAWETGVVADEARWQLVRDRLAPACVGVALGAVALLARGLFAGRCPSSASA